MNHIAFRISIGAPARAAIVREYREIPMYRIHHAKELLDHEAFNQLEEFGTTSETYAKFIHDQTRQLLPKEWKNQSRRVARALIDVANRYQMDPSFLMAVIQQESRFNPAAKGRHGEIGLMQVKPSTARWMVLRTSKVAPSIEKLETLLEDPVANIRYGAAYLAHLRTQFDGQKHLYISAYNMGPNAVRAKLKEGIKPRIYSTKVLALYNEFLTGYKSSIDPEFSNRQYASIH